MAISMNTLESIIIGLTLSSACGFRIFVPPLVISLAVIKRHLPITSGFEWVGTYPALWAFAIATVVEIGAYYIPVLDNLLDTLATSTALAVGTFVAAALFPDSDPLLQWTMAAIALWGYCRNSPSFNRNYSFVLYSFDNWVRKCHYCYR